MAGEIQLNSTTMATESSGSITAQLDTIRPNTTNGSLTLQGDSGGSGVTGMTIDSSGVANFPNGLTNNGDGFIGHGQTWQNVTGSRATSTTYTNSTGKPIMVVITAYDVSSTKYLQCNTGSGFVSIGGFFDTGLAYLSVSGVVPDGATYQVNGGTIINWSELR